MTLPPLPEVVPIFPIPEHVFLPGAANPYHIFEPRYRQMTRDLIASPGESRWLAIPCVKGRVSEAAPRGAPPIREIATIGRLAAHEALPDGRFHVIVEGYGRCRLDEISTDRLYRRARVFALEDEPSGVDFSAHDAAQALVQLTHRLLGALELPAKPELGIEGLADDPRRVIERLGALLLAPPEARVRFLEARSVEARADLLLGYLGNALAMVESGSGGAEA